MITFLNKKLTLLLIYVPMLQAVLKSSSLLYNTSTISWCIIFAIPNIGFKVFFDGHCQGMKNHTSFVTMWLALHDSHKHALTGSAWFEGAHRAAVARLSPSLGGRWQYHHHPEEDSITAPSGLSMHLAKPPSHAKRWAKSMGSKMGMMLLMWRICLSQGFSSCAHLRKLFRNQS